MAKKKATSNSKNNVKPKGSVKKASAKAPARTTRPTRKDCVPLPVRVPSHSIRVMDPSPDVLFARAHYAFQELLPQIKRDRRVKFVDVGYKFTGGDLQPDIAVRIHVYEKSDTNPIPSSCCHGRVRTDVIRSRFVNAVSEIDSGDGIVSAGGSGTLSMGVKMPGTNEENQWMLMTCAHVVSNGTPSLDTPVLNSGGNDFVGLLTDIGPDYFEQSDDLDVAIFVSSNSIPASERGRFDHLQVRPRTIADPTTDDVARRVRVFKYGGATQNTVGVIDSGMPLFRDIPLEGSVLAKDHFLVDSLTAGQPFATRGDSGAAVVTEDGRLIGIVRGVATTGADSMRAVITPMSRIAGRFGFTIVSS